MKFSLKLILPIIFAAAVVILNCWLLMMFVSVSPLVSDFPEYYAAAKMLLSGHGADVYVLDSLRAVQQTMVPAQAFPRLPIAIYMPPFTLSWLAPLGWLPQSVAPYVWKALLVVATGVTIAILRKTYSLNLKALCWLVALLGVSAGFFESIKIDQIAPLLLLALVFAVVSLKQGKDFRAAVALCFLTLKPQIALPIIAYMLGARKWKPVLFWAGLCGLMLCFSVVEFGPRGYANYTALMKDSIEASQYMQPELNATLRGQLLQFFPSAKTTIMYACSAVYAAMLLACAGLGWRFSKHGKWLEAGLLTVIPMATVLSLHCHDYDWLLLTPSLVVLLSSELEDQVPPWAMALGMLAGITFVLPAYIFIHYNYMLKGTGHVNPYFFFLLLLAVGLIPFVLRHADEFKHDIE